MRWKGRDAWIVRLPGSGISYSDVLHRAFAARWWRMTPYQFEELEEEERTLMISVYEANTRIEGLMIKKQQADLDKKTG